MTLSVFAIVLFAAALHATWNAVVKGSSDKLLMTGLVTGSAALIATVIVPFLPPPAPASWPFLATSTVLQIGYYQLVARAYQIADMSQTYPVMRGTAPLLVAIVSAVFLGEHLPFLAWGGIAMISAGILSMAAGAKSGQGKGTVLALINAVVIASYTLVDGAGVRQSGDAVAYTLWAFLLTGVPLVSFVFATRRSAFVHYIASNWRQGLFGGFGTLVSYGLALWAMTIAPIAVIAALRETSILFGVGMSALVLRERVTAPRLAGAIVIVGGAVALRLA
jgi:drug/metabolite transporter (DMT)-like permease